MLISGSNKTPFIVLSLFFRNIITATSVISLQPRRNIITAESVTPLLFRRNNLICYVLFLDTKAYFLPKSAGISPH